MGEVFQNKQKVQVCLTADEPRCDLHFNLVLILTPNDQQASIIISDRRVDITFLHFPYHVSVPNLFT